MPDQPSIDPPAVFLAPSSGERCARCSALLDGASICPQCQADNVIESATSARSASAADAATWPGPRHQPNPWIGVTLIGLGAFLLLTQLMIVALTTITHVGADAARILLRIVLLVLAVALIARGAHLYSRYHRSSPPA